MCSLRPEVFTGETTIPLVASDMTESNQGVNRFRVCVVLVGICIAATVLLQACGGRKEYSYATLADAAKAGEINRGWIPDYLPTSSHAIRIIYDPSSPRTWCAFEFSPADSQILKKNLTSGDALRQLLKRVA